jgi:hypothetical protein
MLHFIFNIHGVNVLINYNIVEGEYVLQVPYYPGYIEFEYFTKNRCEEIIKNCLYKEASNLDDIDIKIQEVGKWTMRNAYSEFFKTESNKVFIIGDASHQYPPSGGFGLNNGVLDSYSLVWRLGILNDLKLNNISIDELNKVEYKIFQDYNNERLEICKFISKCAEKNFKKFLKTAEQINLNKENLKYIESGLSLLPENSKVKSNLFSMLTSIGYSISSSYLFRLTDYLKNSKNCISLVHPVVDYQINNKNTDENSKSLDKYNSDTLTLENFNCFKIGEIVKNYPIKRQILIDYINKHLCISSNNIIKTFKQENIGLRELISYLNNYYFFKIINDSSSTSNLEFEQNHKKENDEIYEKFTFRIPLSLLEIDLMLKELFIIYNIDYSNMNHINLFRKKIENELSAIKTIVIRKDHIIDFIHNVE